MDLSISMYRKSCAAASAHGCFPLPSSLRGHEAEKLYLSAHSAVKASLLPCYGLRRPRNTIRRM